LTLLGTSYVWHGKGSLPNERQAALEYAQSLTAEGSNPVVLIEKESDDNDLFWMMLGDAGYASADYWKWRPKMVTTLPRIWRMDALSAPYVRVVLTLYLPHRQTFTAYECAGLLYTIKRRLVCLSY
jgi:hypothetical protein